MGYELCNGASRCCSVSDQQQDDLNRWALESGTFDVSVGGGSDAGKLSAKANL